MTFIDDNQCQVKPGADPYLLSRHPFWAEHPLMPFMSVHMQGAGWKDFRPKRLLQTAFPTSIAKSWLALIAALAHTESASLHASKTHVCLIHACTTHNRPLFIAVLVIW